MLRKIRAKLALTPALVRAIRLIWQAAPRLLVAWACLLVLQGILPGAVVYLTRIVVDTVVEALRSNDPAALRAAIFAVLAMGGVSLLGLVAYSASGWLQSALEEHVRDHVVDLVQQQSIAIDLALYETAAFHDLLYRVRAEASSRPLELLRSLGSLFQNTITLAMMAVLLAQFGAILPLALVVSTLPALVTVLWVRERRYRWWRSTTEAERRLWYYDEMLTSGEAAAELRIFDLGARFRSAYRTTRGPLRDGLLALAKEQTLADLATSGFALVVTAGATVLMIARATRGDASLGDVALFYTAFSAGQGLLRSLLQNLGDIYACGLFLTNLFEFLELEPAIRQSPDARPAPRPLTEGIRFENVTFHYPGSAVAALRDFDLVVPAGRVTALVGTNGAGKSTLLKLLCRLYDPDSGRIAIDGVDLRQIEVAELRRLVTVLFQEPVHYSATVAENIEIGDVRRRATRADVAAAADAAGANELIERLPDKLDTLLGKRFLEGTELSVGEWQRLALARAFLREAPVILLDEPTSAMDAWAEAEWFDRFRALAEGRTAIIVTHRLTTAMRADLIHVMADGRLLEQGSHRELLARGGAYADAWTRQMDLETPEATLTTGRERLRSRS